jgi:peptidoglycan/LPS O-acetylase OafA/YrhL
MESFSDRDLAAATAPVKDRFEEIDTLRALAMIGVVAQHCQLFPPGWIGVWLFYVISGFVVTGAIRSRTAEGSAGQALKNFYIRRAARIWPIYFLVLALAAITSLLVDRHVPWPAVASFALFYNNYALAHGFGEIPAFNLGNLWTVSVEM